jgi:TRAP transporter TAXI family solute receptor
LHSPKIRGVLPRRDLAGEAMSVGSRIRGRWCGWAIAAVIIVLCGSAPTGAQEARYFRIGAGGTGGSFFEIAGVIAGAISKPPGTPSCEKGGSCGVPGLVAVAQATQGSVDNLRLITAGQIESGIVQSDIAGWAFTGAGPFAGEGAMKQMRAVASLFPERLQIVVRADGPVKSLADLRGRRISLGETESGTLVDARILLEAAGLRERDLIAEYQRPSTAAANVGSGALDGLFLIGGVPVPALRDLAAATPIRLVPIDDDVLSRLQRIYSLYRRDIIPADAYPGIESSTPSIGFRAIWVVAGDAPEELVYAMTKALWSEATRRLLDASGPIGRQVVLEEALDGLPVPLHPGAKRFYRETGLPVEDETPNKEAN